VYDLPNRDCAALASSGELLIAQNGFARYQAEYIDPIVNILRDFPQLRIVAIIEVDSLPNLVTNLNVAACSEANGPGGYRDGIRYALNRLATLPNVYSYIDIAHSGWLGWASNFGPAVTLIGDVVVSTTNGWGSIHGFASNSANYTPVQEPYLPNPNLSVGGQPVKSASFYEFNDYLEELKFVQDWRTAMISRGAPSRIGMLIDTGRNGWGGSARPTAVSTSTTLNTYVDQSRIDRRFHRGNWCNQRGGVGFRPQANPATGVHAYVWIKPQGESDGISDPNFTPDPNDPAKRHDPMCDPNARNTSNNAVGTGAMPNAPHAGRWFPDAFRTLLQNAYPPL
jgi:cellulose 1,4-beta-cellobiosidase